MILDYGVFPASPELASLVTLPDILHVAERDQVLEPGTIKELKTFAEAAPQWSRRNGGVGGGIFTSRGIVTLTNSTLSGNSAGAGGFSSGSYGGYVPARQSSTPGTFAQTSRRHEVRCGIFATQPELVTRRQR